MNVNQFVLKKVVDKSHDAWYDWFMETNSDSLTDMLATSDAAALVRLAHVALMMAATREGNDDMRGKVQSTAVVVRMLSDSL